MKIQGSEKILALVAVTLTVIFWASSFVGIRIGLVGYTPGALALLRYGVASICMLILYFLQDKRSRITGRDLLLLVLLGIIGFGVYNVTLNIGELTVPAGIASFIVSLIPVGITILAVIFLGERLSVLATIGVLVSISGIVVIAIGEHAGMKFDIGVVYVLIATISGSIYSVAQKAFCRKYRAIEITAIAMWGGTLAMMVYLPQLIHQLPHAPAAATYAAIYMGIFPAAIAYVAWTYALSKMPASYAASYLYFLPIVTTLLGFLFLAEVPAALSLVGGFIALAGAVVVGRARKAKVPLPSTE